MRRQRCDKWANPQLEYGEFAEPNNKFPEYSYLRDYLDGSSIIQNTTFIKLAPSSLIMMSIPADWVDRDSGGEMGHRAQAGGDTETKCFSRLESGIPIHLHSPNPPHQTVVY